MTLTSGARLAHYEILEPIGKGGMGEVYRAKDGKLGRDVAIKVLPDEFAQDEERLRRFQREAKVLASLNHPNIAAIYGLEQSGDTHYLVLELVPGETLADRIARGPIPVDEALEIATKIAEALEEAHERGIVHRDLKPANIKLTPDDKIKVLDFGLAKAFAEEGAEGNAADSKSPTITRDATRVGVVLGTAAYMSPEQAKGKRVDKRADIWALGAMLYEMLTGTRAFAGEDVSETMAFVLTKEPAWETLPQTTPAAVCQVLQLCLEKDAAHRVRDIGDVRLAIKGAFNASGISTGDAARGSSRSAGLWVAATFALAAATAIAAWNLKPAEEKSVTRFVYDLPDYQTFTGIGGPLMAISRDGRRFVYTANRQLYLRSLDETVAEPISGTQGAMHPTFSPDGEWVAYWAGGQLKKIGLDGGTPVVLSDSLFPYGLDWTEDDTIIYAVDEGVMRLPANGGLPERIIEGRGIYAAEMLPDGQTLLFFVDTGVTNEVTVESILAREPKTLFEGNRARYLPTGHIVFERDGALFGVPFDRHTLDVIGGPIPLVEGVDSGGGVTAAQFEISDTGVLVYVARGSFYHLQSVLGLIDRAGDVERLPLPPSRYETPRFSPDGSKLVVAKHESGGVTLWIHDLSSSRALQQLTSGPHDEAPVWSPDEETIAFASNRGGNHGIFSQPADGSRAAKRLTTAEDGTWHLPSSWSPDGRMLAYAEVAGGVQGEWRIWMLSLEDGATARLDQSTEDRYGPHFSPDGHWIAYSDNDNIYVEPFPSTGAQRRISSAGGDWPVWSRRGMELFYQPDFGQTVAFTDFSEIRWVGIETEPELSVTEEHVIRSERFVVHPATRQWDISSNGEKFVAMFPTGSTHTGQRIHVVVNWFEELKARVPTDN